MSGYTVGEAEEIAEDLLHRTGRGLTQGDFDCFRVCFELPQALETLEGVRVLRHEGDLRRVFDSIREYYRESEVVDLVRTVVSAEFVDHDTIESTHVSRLLRPGGALFRTPYPAYSIIKRRGNDWKITFTHYVILDSRKHNEALVAWKVDGEEP